MSDGYFMAVHRVSTGLDLTSNLWDKSPDIKSDLVADYEALQAWGWVPTCYSLIEQAFKLLWGTREDVPVKKVKEELRKTLGKWKEAYNLTILFGMLTPDDQKGIDIAYRAYRKLHDYIPIPTVKEFLKEIGTGYVGWRYILMDGTEGIPSTHIGAMLEIARACVRILKIKHLGGNGFPTVEVRTKKALHDAVVREVNDYADNQKEQYPDDVEFLEVFVCRMKYVDNLLNKKSDLVYKILSDKGPPNVNMAPRDFGDCAVIRRICQALSEKDKKNSRQYFLQKISGRSL